MNRPFRCNRQSLYHLSASLSIIQTHLRTLLVEFRDNVSSDTCSILIRGAGAWWTSKSATYQKCELFFILNSFTFLMRQHHYNITISRLLHSHRRSVCHIGLAFKHMKHYTHKTLYNFTDTLL